MMKRKIGIFILLLGGLFVLIHTVVPHHHHMGVFVVEEHQCHHEDGDMDHHDSHILNELMVTAATEHHEVDFHLLTMPVSVENFEFTDALDVFSFEIFITPQVYLEKDYSHFVQSSKGLRAPPVVYC